ncbi:MAG: hypothetical protein GXO74_16365 [Calditrichaeota bacterium]|nr:hypothetical protein [Calditrichota bacterium]
MIDQSVLFQAKSFLCWDRFAELSIQLVPVQTAVGYFYPPRHDLASIVLFYHIAEKDVTEALCLLFHEVGHFLQWKSSSNREDFLSNFQLDKGSEKIKFETQAWELGKSILIEFIDQHDSLNENILKKFDRLKQQSLRTYFAEGA